MGVSRRYWDFQAWIHTRSTARATLHELFFYDTITKNINISMYYKGICMDM
jgi:hypothetical protein